MCLQQVVRAGEPFFSTKISWSLFRMPYARMKR